MLHIISNLSSNNAVLQRIDQGDAVLFIENAVFSLIEQGRYAQKLEMLLKTNTLYALSSDLKIRGIALDGLVVGIEVTDYPGFVQLTIEHSLIKTWC